MIMTRLTEEEKRTHNSTYKKLAVQWLNEALCFVSSSVVADSFRLRNRQLLVAATDVTKSLRASVTSPGGFAVRSPFRDFVHLKVLQNAKHFAKPPGVRHKVKPTLGRHIPIFPTAQCQRQKNREE